MQVTFCRVLLAFVSLGSLIPLRSGPGPLARQLRAHWRAVLVLCVFNFAVSQILAMSAQCPLPASVNGLLKQHPPTVGGDRQCDVLSAAAARTARWRECRRGALVDGDVTARLQSACNFPGIGLGDAQRARKVVTHYGLIVRNEHFQRRFVETPSA
jgi:hypothetical protein